VASEARKCTIKYVAKYIKMEIFFNKTTFVIDRRLIKYTENYLFVSRRN